jgi:hypothetical protein
MKAHVTGFGSRDRRAKGRNRKPEAYLTGEILALVIVVFMLSFLKIKLLTVLSIVAAIYFVMVSSVPRYKRVVLRQEGQKANAHKVEMKESE